ncbi:MAG: hypothetical protein WCQ53_03615 [bacterium]
MLKKTCLVLLALAFINCNQLSAVERRFNPADGTNATTSEDTQTNSLYSVYGTVIKVDSKKDQSAVITIKNSKGELDRCIIAADQKSFLEIALVSVNSKANVKCNIDGNTNVVKSIELD